MDYPGFASLDPGYACFWRAGQAAAIMTEAKSSLRRLAAAGRTYYRQCQKARHVKASDARRDRTPGERGVGAKRRHHQTGPDAYRVQMQEMRSAKSRFGSPWTDTGVVHVQGMRRRTKDIVSAATMHFDASGLVALRSACMGGERSQIKDA